MSGPSNGERTRNISDAKFASERHVGPHLLASTTPAQRESALAVLEALAAVPLEEPSAAIETDNHGNPLHTYSVARLTWSMTHERAEEAQFLVAYLRRVLAAAASEA
jgi:hypothetical protein